MCGICGLLSLSGADVDVRVLEEMNRTLVHRGPDSGGVFVEGSVGIAARRLAIIDLVQGDQPIANEDGTIHVVQNGEIYNYRELRRELESRGHRFATHSDTEVLVHLYEDRGVEFVSDLRGMFAVAIWDSRRRRLVLARDRYGIKPLYYRFRDEILAFGSELKALEPVRGRSRSIDPEAVEAFLAFNVIPAPLTIYEDTRKLPAGHVLVWDEHAGGHVPELRRYGRPRPVATEALRRDAEETLAQELLERLRDSVRAHLIADVPVGVLLSGGLDSSALAALAASESSSSVMTFSIGFEERSFNELEQARLVARRYGTDHHELVLKPDAADLLPAIVEAFDEPFADSSALPTYLVSRLAAQHVKVALSGEGGDELFGGYNTYVADLLAPRFGVFARLARPLINSLPTSPRASSFDYRAKRFARAAHLPALERHHGWREIFSADARAELIAIDRTGFDPFDLVRARYDETAESEELARLMDVDMGPYLMDDLLVKTDRASMAHSLEVRVPFLDPAVTDFALELPTGLKVRGLSRKRLLRRAVAPLLPPEILRGRKRGFSIPAAAWLRGDLAPMLRDLLSADRVRHHGIFRPEAVTRLVDSHIGRQADYSHQLWGLLMFSLWLERSEGLVAGTAAAHTCESVSRKQFE